MERGEFKKNYMGEDLTEVLRPPRFVVQLALLNQEMASQFPALLKNLSAHGAFVETIPSCKGKVIDLEFSFPGQKNHFHITARIVWSRTVNETNKFKSPGLGVEFLCYNQGTKEDLENQLKYWGELALISESDLHIPALLTEPHTGCLGRPANTDTMIFFSTLDDNEIDDAITTFMSNTLQ